MEEASQAKKKRGELIVITSPKGGVGKTILAVNLAVALCKKNVHIALMDGDFQFGDVSLSLDLQSSFTMKDVIEDENLDAYSLSSYLNHHDSGVKVLAAPERPEYADLIDAEKIETIMDLLLEQNHFVIVDTGVGFHENNLKLFDMADQILCITNLEMSTLKNTKLMLETFETLSIYHKVELVINRATMESVIKPTDVTGIIGINDPIYIPNDFQTATQSLNIGIPFVTNQAKTDLAKAYYKMAERLYSKRELTMFQPKKGSFLSKIFSKNNEEENHEDKMGVSNHRKLMGRGRNL